MDKLVILGSLILGVYYCFKKPNAKPLNLNRDKIHMVQGDGKQNLMDYLKESKDQVQEALDSKGAVLFRNFSVPQKTYLLSPLGYHVPSKLLDRSNKSLVTILGHQPKTFVAPGVFRSTTLPSSRIILPHTELAFMGDDAPDLIGFHVLDHKELSETPLIDFRGMMAHLQETNSGLYERLVDAQLTMGYSFPSRSPLVQSFVEWLWGQSTRTMGQAFCLEENDDSIEMVRDARSRGFDISCAFEQTMIEVNALRPSSSTLAWCGDFWGAAPFYKALDVYRDRFSVAERLFWKGAYWLRKGFGSMDPDPTRGSTNDLTETDLNTLMDLMWDPRFFIGFQWQKGDVLVVNNRVMGHSRAPRGFKIMTAMYGYKQ